MSNTNTGVSELTIPVTALSSWVCANAKRKAGIKLPIKPDINIRRRYFLSILRSQANAKGNINREADNIRIEATCVAVYTVRPFLIKINELPQMIVKRISKAQDAKWG
jgi:hypothetical protein